MKVFPSYVAIPENGSFLFVLQSQPFYQVQLVPVTTISKLRNSLARVEEAEVSHLTKRDCTYDDHFHLGSLARLEGEAVCLSRTVHRRSLKKGVSV